MFLLLFLLNGNTFITFAMKKVSEVLKMLEKDVWYILRTKGSHRQLKHPIKSGLIKYPIKSGLITIPGKLSSDIPKGTPGSIMRQAGPSKILR